MDNHTDKKTTAEEMFKKHYFTLENASESDWNDAMKNHPDFHNCLLSAMEEYATLRLTELRGEAESWSREKLWKSFDDYKRGNGSLSDIEKKIAEIMAIKDMELSDATALLLAKEQEIQEKEREIERLKKWNDSASIRNKELKEQLFEMSEKDVLIDFLIWIRTEGDDKSSSISEVVQVYLDDLENLKNNAE